MKQIGLTKAIAIIGVFLVFFFWLSYVGTEDAYRRGIADCDSTKIKEIGFGWQTLSKLHFEELAAKDDTIRQLRKLSQIHGLLDSEEYKRGIADAAWEVFDSSMCFHLDYVKGYIAGVKQKAAK
jgi:hypothetical protein